MLISDYLTVAVPTSIFVLLAVKAILAALGWLRFTRKFKNLPQDPGHWLWGELKEYPGPNDAGLAFDRAMTAKFPRMRVSWNGWVPILIITHPDLVKVILKSSEPKSNLIYGFLHPWIGRGLLTSNGREWARSRRLLTPAFHYDVLKGYIKMKNELSDVLLEKFENAAKSGQSLDVFANISMFTLDVVLQSIMSYETGCQKDGEKHPYIIAVNRIMERLSERFMKPWLFKDLIYFMTPTGMRFLRDCRFVHSIADEVIAKRKEELKNNDAGGEVVKRKHQDFLDTLITARDEDGNGLTDKEIRDQVDTFLFEGHDTTASAISWTLYSVAEHPDVQKRIQEELDDLFGDSGSDYLTWEDLPKLTYLTMVLKEAMRLHTPVPVIMRELTKDIVLDGYTIPEGTNIDISTYCTHHHPSVWPDSMKFDPERFSPENARGNDPFSFIPFSAGPRNCIGQNFAMEEMKLALARILHRYDISLDKRHNANKFMTLVMKAEKDIKICLKPRF